MNYRKRTSGPGAAFFGAAMAVGAALILTMILILINSPAPQKTIRAFFVGPWSSPWFFGNTLDYTGLLLTAALGTALAFRGGTFNLGGEGQIYLGGLAASAVLLLGAGGQGGPLQSPAGNTAALCLAALAAMTAGGLMGFLPGILKKRLAANELITSFLLAAALSSVADYLIGGPWRDASGNLLALPTFGEGRLLPRILPPSNLSVSFIAALILAAAGHVFINKTVWGYRFRISGAAADFARYGGIEPEKVWAPAMTASGALLGLAGFFAVAGTYGRCHLGFPGGLGWNAVAVALIARNRPLALFPAALIYGWLKAGSDSAFLEAGLNLEGASFIQAAVLILATVRFTLPFIKGRK